jgi:hypothetical protein
MRRKQSGLEQSAGLKAFGTPFNERDAELFDAMTPADVVDGTEGPTPARLSQESAHADHKGAKGARVSSEGGGDHPGIAAIQAGP